MVKGVLVSVIVPVYAVERYLDACIKSIIEQSHKNLEIILVNDKSPDKSGAICDEWAKKDNRIHVIHKQKNEGVNMARLTGHEHSHGKYLTFLDSDDIFHKNNIEKSLSVLLENDADIVAYAHHEFSDANKDGVLVDSEEAGSRARLLKTKDEIARYAFFGDGNLAGVFRMTKWGKLYRRNVIEKVDWSLCNYRFYEDNFWIVQALLAAKKIAIIPDKLVNYRRNAKYNHVGPSLSGQLTGNMQDGKPVGYLEQVTHLYDLDIKLAKKYKMHELKDRLEDKYYGEMLWRMDGLNRSGLLGAENNLEFVPDVWEWYRAYHIRLREENVHLREENASYLGIKRSARLLLGNIKRKVINIRKARNNANQN